MTDAHADSQLQDGVGGAAESDGTRSSRLRRVGPWVLAALVASPIVVGALTLVGETWLPVSDWAALLYRTSQVGTRDTPLVGPYSWQGFAHPGPMLFWAAAPFYRLSGGDPRSILWTAAIVNTLCVAGIAAVAWRRGRWPLLVGTLAMLGLLLHGLSPDNLVDLWNPYVGLMPFLLAVFLMWDGAMGRRRALLEAVLPASFAAQSHVAFLTLLGLVGLWLVVWLVARRQAAAWIRIAGIAAAIAVVLWLPPLIDALAGAHNPKALLESVTRPGASVGWGRAPAVLGQYVAPTGRWIRGGDPSQIGRPDGTDAIPYVVFVVAVLGCVYVGWRRRLTDVLALATLTATLALGAVPVASKIIAHPPSYLVQWMKIVAALGWFTVGWTAWRLVAGQARAVVHRGFAVAAAGVIAATTVWSWGAAADLTPPEDLPSEMLAEIRSGFRDNLDPDARYRLAFPNDAYGFMAGLTYWLADDGHDVVTDDGLPGVKWGRELRWRPGDPHDAVLTIATDSSARSDAYSRCMDDPDVELIVDVDQLTPEEQDFLASLSWRRLQGPDAISDEDAARARELAPRNRRLRIFMGPAECGLE